ncbi:MAG: hypothetical protein CVV42_09505 [Candidatus Riflebacteria bacterium HGW-Riflebacteria-2]|nr:MAG: hypothetical protein CVV42_09505 [Candidatus Riflebacteria bacterium HGW-Riflebacteria-2]
MAICIVPIAGTILWSPIVNISTQNRKRACLEFLIVFGFACFIIFGFFYNMDPDRFLFSNFEYHALRGDSGLIGNWRQKLDTVFRALGIYGSERDMGIQSWIIFFAALGSILLKKSRDHSLPIFGIGIAIAIAHLLPSPTYEQYFVMLFAMLIPLASVFLSSEATLKPATRILVTVILIVYYVSGLSTVTRATLTGNGITGLSGHLEKWRIQGIIRMTKMASKLASGDNAMVYSTWSGYLVGLDKKIIPGTENHFAQFIAPKLSEKERNRLNIPVISEIFARANNNLIVIKGVWVEKAEFAKIDSLVRHKVVFDHADQQLLIYGSFENDAQILRRGIGECDLPHWQ